jgi:hypothetical protein
MGGKNMILTKSKFMVVILILTVAFLSITVYSKVSSSKQFSSDLEINTSATYKHYATIDELDADADLIIVGSPTQDFESRKHEKTYFEDGLLQDFYTITGVKVKSIIKQPADFNMNKANIIEIIEPISVISTPEGDKKIKIENYSALKKGSFYVIFLKKNTFGNYAVLNLEAGKYNIDKTDKDDLISNEKIELYKELQTKYKDFIE